MRQLVHTKCVLVVLALMISMVLAQTTLAPAADARCAGASAFHSTLNDPGPIVTEWPSDGTCNSNGTYHGFFQNNVSSAWRATVWIHNSNHWTEYAGGYDTGVYSYGYVDSNSYSDIVLCLDDHQNWLCGWGTSFVATLGGPDLSNYGVNYGF